MTKIDEDKIQELLLNLSMQDIRSLAWWDDLSGRNFGGRVPLGAGMHSANCVALLHALLQRAIEHLGGMQQGPTDAADQAILVDIMSDLCSAILGMEPKFDGETFGDIAEAPNIMETLIFIQQKRDARGGW